MQSFLSQKFRPCNRYRRFFPYSLQNISDSRSAALKLRSLQIFYLPVFIVMKIITVFLFPYRFKIL